VDEPTLVTAGEMSRVKAAYDCIKASSETDFTEDLKGPLPATTGPSVGQTSP
jgi:hypothetical protein